MFGDCALTVTFPKQDASPLPPTKDPTLQILHVASLLFPLRLPLGQSPLKWLAECLMPLQAIILADLPPSRLLTQENMLLRPNDGPYHRLVICSPHGHAGPIRLAMVFHEQRGSAAAAGAANGDRRCPELDIGLRLARGRRPGQGVVAEVAKGDERCAGQLAASRAVADRDGDGKGAAGIADEAARAAASEGYRSRRGSGVGCRFHVERTEAVKDQQSPLINIPTAPRRYLDLHER